MKTSVVMIREMGDFKISQRTKDGFFNATSLIKLWNAVKGNPKRSLGDFFRQKGTKDFINVLIEDKDLHVVNSPYVKSKASRGINAGTWVHPYLFIKIAMWINPKFELHVIKFVYDQLIDFRHKAGDNYRSLSASASVYPNVDYPQLAKALNWNTFNKHERGIRQTATSEQLDELHKLEEQLTFAIDMGYIKTFEQLISDLRNRYNSKYNKF